MTFHSKQVRWSRNLLMPNKARDNRDKNIFLSLFLKCTKANGLTNHS